MWRRHPRLPTELHDGPVDNRDIGRSIEVLDLDHAPRYGGFTVRIDRRGGLSLPLVDEQLVVVNPNPNADDGIRHESIFATGDQ